MRLTNKFTATCEMLTNVKLALSFWSIFWKVSPKSGIFLASVVCLVVKLPF